MFIKLFFLFFIIFSSHFAFAADEEMKVSENPKAQVFFDQGMLWYWAYNYSQAKHDFKMALMNDPKCSMCYWGLALAKKHQALELSQWFGSIGYEDIRIASELLQENPHPIFSDIVIATSKTFSLDPKDTNLKLQKQYIKALRELYKKYQSNHDFRTNILSLFLDALVYYTGVEQSNMQAHCQPMSTKFTEEAISLTKPIITDSSYKDHPGLLHGFIHAAELSINEPLNLVVAHKLYNFATKHEMAHYIHMPVHVYWRIGKIKESIELNLKTIEMDNKYFENGGVGFNSYYYEYHYLHSHNFLAALATINNNYEIASKYAKEIKNLMNPNRIKYLFDYKDRLLSLEHLVLAKFEEWDEVLALDIPEQMNDLGFLFVNFSRALAYLHKGDMVKFKEIYKRVETDKIPPHLNNLRTLALTYIRASKMDLNNASLDDLIKIFEKNDIDALENIIHNNNPPVWFFYHESFLYKAAKKRGDKKSAQLFYDAYKKHYPEVVMDSQ